MGALRPIGAAALVKFIALKVVGCGFGRARLVANSLYFFLLHQIYPAYVIHCVLCR